MKYNKNDVIPHPNHTHTHAENTSRRARYAITLSVAKRFFIKLQTL